ncbi:MAG: thiamine diphosphokinase [Butyricicoccaceae bacterium]
MKAVIIASAPETDIGYVRGLIDADTYVICADGGQRHARALGITPDLVVGDFDSGDAPDGGSIIRLKPEKDDSDLMCCIHAALERGCDSIVLTCASGGRIDHFLSNLSVLEYLAQQGISGVLYDSRNRVRFHRGTHTYPADEQYRYIGIIPLDETLEGVTLRGLKYLLDDAVVHRSRMITISNEAAAPEFTVSIQKGCALLVECRD